MTDICAACRRDHNICICECGPSDGVMPVDAALRQIDKRGAYAEEGSDLFSARVLAAEVRRLRDDQAQCGKDYCALMDKRDALHVECERLRERVSALDVDNLAYAAERAPLVNEVMRLREQNARLKYQVTLRDMQLSTHRELLAQAEAKNDELRGRWDRAETAREELQKLVEQTRAIATQRVEAAHAAPRYSTEAVDVFLEASIRLILWLQLKYKEPLKLVQYRDLCAAAETVRASREPK